MPNLALQPANAPGDSIFPPPNAQALLNFVAAYLQVSGLESLTGVIVSATEPAAPDRDKLWAKVDESSSRVIGLYAYTSGQWGPIPTVIPSGEQEPGAPKLGEMFFNTALKALRFYDGTSWTTNLWPQGNTASRPEGVPAGYLYFDTGINRLLRMTAQGWSTFDGGVGQIAMWDAASEQDVLDKNPGWAIFAALGGRFPIGQSDDVPPQKSAGVTLDETKLTWSAQRRSASGGSREASATFIAELTINGVAATADGTKSDAMSKIGSDKKVDLTPPYYSVFFIRKEF